MARGPKIADGGNYQTAWLKFKTVKGRNGDLEVLQGSIDMGNGNMIKLTCYAERNTVDVKGESMFPINITKWKSTRQNSQNRNKKAW